MGTDRIYRGLHRACKAPGGGERWWAPVGQSFELLPVEERIQQYREFADATFLKAQKVQDAEVRAHYLSLATL